MIISVGIKKGKGKSRSEDVAIIGRIIQDDGIEVYKYDTRPALLGISDGVGGNPGGDEASRKIVELLSEFEGVVGEVDLERHCHECNKELLSLSNQTPGREKMAATFTGVFCLNNKCVLAHIGNTRMYSAQGSYFKQITDDHTIYQWLMERGRIDDAAKCRKNEINGCFGGGTGYNLNRLQIKTIDVEPFSQMLLLTSDGVHEYVDLDFMEEILNDKCSDTESIDRLLLKASENGSTDDKTVMVIRG